MAPVKLLKFTFSQKLRSLDKQEKEIKNNLDKLVDKYEINKIQKQLIEINKSRTILKQGQATYRRELEAITTAVHPFTLISKIQSSEQVAKKLQHSLASLRCVVSCSEIKDKKHLLNKFERQIHSVSSLTNLWWQWVDTNLFNKNEAIETQAWAKQYLLPYVYWKAQVKKSKFKKLLRAYYKKLHLAAEEKLRAHPLTEELLMPTWINWASHMCSKHQRTTSAIERRNGLLPGFNHCSRGMTELQLESQTIIHN